MSFKSSSAFKFLDRYQLLIGGIILVCLYAFYISSLGNNPPGFYVDESCLAYNGYLVGHTGVAENGDTFPLYFQCYTQGYSQWANPTHVYLLGIYYLFVPPSNLSSRIFAATMVFLAALLLGFLAMRLSGKRAVGIIVALSAMFTPWLFEISRLVLETFFYPLAVVLFLFCLYNAHKRETWSTLDSILIAVTLALVTYSYTIGRLLGPLLGLGLILFAVNRKVLISVIKTWVIYAVLLVPLLIAYFNNSAAITQRFARATNLSADRSIWENVSMFVTSYISDISPTFLIFDGDLLSRHHIAGTGEFLIGTFALAILGIVIVLIRHRRSAWWRYILFGLVVSVVPGSLTIERHHSLRMVAFPVFFLLLLVPALSWLLSKGREETNNEPSTSERGNRDLYISGVRGLDAKRVLLIGVLVMTVVQAVMFQLHFRAVGGDRVGEFDASYPKLLNQALAEEDRPIYLEDGGIPAYVHAYWYATVQGVDRSNFVHLLDYDQPPEGALVLSSKGVCSNCETINQDGNFILYRNRQPPREPIAPPGSAPTTKPVSIPPGNAPGQFLRPRGISTDTAGNQYVADTDNVRIQKFTAEGEYGFQFGYSGENEGELKRPQGIAVDTEGSIYVTDSANQKLVRFNPDGKYSKEWKGPEPGFNDPVDIAFAPDGSLYIVEQAGAKVDKFDPASEAFTTWGERGSGNGQFADPTGISIGGGFVFVADTGNARVQIFDLNGKYIRQWPVPQWKLNAVSFPDIVYDETSKRVFVTSGSTMEVFAYSPEGKFVEAVKPPSPYAWNNPSSLAIAHGEKGRWLFVLNTGSDSPTATNPGIVIVELSDPKLK